MDTPSPVYKRESEREMEGGERDRGTQSVMVMIEHRQNEGKIPLWAPDTHLGPARQQLPPGRGRDRWTAAINRVGKGRVDPTAQQRLE
jgi:hypothetical protein